MATCHRAHIIKAESNPGSYRFVWSHLPEDKHQTIQCVEGVQVVAESVEEYMDQRTADLPVVSARNHVEGKGPSEKKTNNPRRSEGARNSNTFNSMEKALHRGPMRVSTLQVEKLAKRPHR